MFNIIFLFLEIFFLGYSEVNYKLNTYSCKIARVKIFINLKKQICKQGIDSFEGMANFFFIFLGDSV